MFSKTIPLNEFITLQRGFDLPRDDREEGCVPVVASTGIAGYHNVAKVTAPGVVIGRSGSIGGGQFITEEFWPLNTTLWVKDFNGHYPRYIYYLLRSIDFQKFNVGSGVPTLNRNHLGSVLVSDIGFEQEKRIADILGGLDDKIELNRQTNQTLEQIAQAIFKSWFVDFEPTRAKIIAQDMGADTATQELASQAIICGALTLEQLADIEQNLATALQEAIHTKLSHNNPTPINAEQLATTAALFPNALVNSELGEIPEGWTIGSFKDLCVKVESGGTPKRNTPEYWGGEIKWLASGEVRDVVVLDTNEKITKSGLKNSSAKLWPMYTTVVAMYGATAGQVCLIADQMTSNQACCGLIPKKNYRAFTFFSAKRSIESLSDKASGSAQQNLNKGIVEGHPAILPAEAVLAVYEDLAFPLILKWIESIRESVMLAELRDTLLPKLLSGELDVSALADDSAPAIKTKETFDV